MSTTDELRIAVVFLRGLEMPRGKSEVQFGHAVAMVLDTAQHALIRQYMDCGQLKLSMEADDIEAIRLKAEARNVNYAVVTDAGRTVFDGPTVTCIGLGPMNKTDCNALTRNARMR